MALHNDLGRKGEEKAAEYLIREGYAILERNWRWRHCELDIICQKDGLLVVVEVKTREQTENRLEELLDYQKRNHIRKAADAFVKSKGLCIEVRFDLILVVGPKMEIQHIKEAIQIFE